MSKEFTLNDQPLAKCALHELESERVGIEHDREVNPRFLLTPWQKAILEEIQNRQKSFVIEVKKGMGK